MAKCTLPDSIFKRDIKKEEKEFQNIGIIADIPNHRALLAEILSGYNCGLPVCGIDPRKPETLKLDNLKNPNSIPIVERLIKQKKNKKSGPRS